MTREFTTTSPEETIALGRELAASLAPPNLVLLRGDLGAGKTTLVKGIAQGLRAASEEDVTSPTFTLVHEYRGPSVTLYHIDLYRLSPREVDDLGLDDLTSEGGIVAVEWPDRWTRPPADAVAVAIRLTGEETREIAIAWPPEF